MCNDTLTQMVKATNYTYHGYDKLDLNWSTQTNNFFKSQKFLSRCHELKKQVSVMSAVKMTPNETQRIQKYKRKAFTDFYHTNKNISSWMAEKSTTFSLPTLVCNNVYRNKVYSVSR